MHCAIMLLGHDGGGRIIEKVGEEEESFLTKRRLYLKGMGVVVVVVVVVFVRERQGGCKC